MPLTDGEEEAWDRMHRAAVRAAARMSMRGEHSVRLRAALLDGDRVAILWAVEAALVWDRHTKEPWYRSLDDAFEALFRECSGAAGPTIRTGGQFDGRSGGRRRGRPPKTTQEEATA